MQKIIISGPHAARIEAQPVEVPAEPCRCLTGGEACCARDQEEAGQGPAAYAVREQVQQVHQEEQAARGQEVR